jgi:lauroyl/myristoyl acyltransferase
VIRVGERWPWAVLIGAVLLTGMAGVGLAGLRLDADPKSLRPDDHPALRAEALLTEGFDLLQDTATVVIPAPDVAQALARSASVRRHLRAVLREAGEGGEITAPSDWLGPGATVVAARRALLAEASPGSPLDLNQAAATLRAALVEEGLDPAFYAPGFAALAALARGEDPVPSVLPPSEAAASWPPAMAELIRQDPSPGGGVWAAVRLRLPAGTWADGPPPDVWAAVVQDAPGAGYASVVALGTDLQRTARRDLRGLGWGALAVVALVVLLSFRGRPGRSLLAFLPVSLGVVWTLGLWGGLGQPLDLISLAVLPILLGIGIDDGLHAVHGAVELGHLGLLPAAVRDAGRAIALTTLTTCAGFLSLRLSHIPGLQAGGLLVALGVAACLVATLLVLPAVGTLLARWVPGCAVDAVAERPPHAPRRGWITGVFWYRALQFGVGCLPSWGRATLNTILAPLFFVFAGWIRRALGSNLEPVLGPAGFWERQRRAFRTWWTFSWCLVERYERFCPSQDKLEVEIEGREIWNHLLESPKGWILITAHMGHWELGSELAVEGQRMVHVVREQEMDPEAQELIRQQVESAVAESTNYKVHFASRDPALGAELLSALRRGDLVCLQGDRPRAHSRAIETTLFGRPFLLPAGPTALARAAGVPMLPIFGFREGRRKARFVFRPPIEVLDTGDRCRDLQTAVQALASEIEWAVRQRPHQWFCFRDLWG